ncbi:MAG: hypothetical protein VCD00_16360, partial [Candidatus Hydrogenedentota bacterium]
AASAIAESWSLPETLSNALLCHHARADRVLKNTKDPRLSALVRIANLAAHDDFLADDLKPEDLPSCNDDEAWAILSETFPVETVYERFELLNTFAAELKSSPELTL